MVLNKKSNVLLGFIFLFLTYYAPETSAFAASIGSSTTTNSVFATRDISQTQLNEKASGSLDEKKKLRTVLVTGGCGYIGSHTCLELLKTGQYQVVVIDNLDNSSTKSLERVIKLCPNLSPDEASNLLHFRNVDIRDSKGVESVLKEFDDISSCIHFAGLKAVGESVAKPLMYYQTNIAGTCTLLECLQKKQIQHFVFSSSATVCNLSFLLSMY